ncbi:MAG: sel1 repeat family protein [Alphaproteobacteria bacterium]|nr:sel1 repeat family protein [Alphaproteobacteria bacterium]
MQRPLTYSFLALFALTSFAWAAEDNVAAVRAAFQHLKAEEFAQSRQIAAPLAEAGDADAQHLLGYIYENGLGVPRDMARALAYYSKAANQGQADSQYALGDLAFTGDGVKRNLERAAGWYKLAAARSHAGAKAQLGVMHAQGLYFPKDINKAIGYFEQAAEAGDADAQYNLGAIYLTGEGKPQDYAKAAGLFEQAALQGHALSQFNLALLYDSELLGAPVPEKTARWMRAAADQAMPDAMVAMGLLTHEGRAGPGEELAADWFERAAKAGNAQGQFLYAVALSEGDGRAKDVSGALVWVERALANEALSDDIAPGARALQQRLKAQPSN